jgi:Putative restriction endonuclease
VIVELLSSSTEAVDRGPKKDLYEKVFKCSNYFLYDPFKPESLTGWHLVHQKYEPLDKNDRGWLWSDPLGLWLGTWIGELNKETAPWLRFYDAAGNLVLLPQEAAQQQAQIAQQQAAIAQQQAEVIQQRAARLAARLRELGEDPDQLA